MNHLSYRHFLTLWLSSKGSRCIFLRQHKHMFMDICDGLGTSIAHQDGHKPLRYPQKVCPNPPNSSLSTMLAPPGSRRGAFGGKGSEQPAGLSSFPSPVLYGSRAAVEACTSTPNASRGVGPYPPNASRAYSGMINIPIAHACGDHMTNFMLLRFRPRYVWQQKRNTP